MWIKRNHFPKADKSDYESALYKTHSRIIWVSVCACFYRPMKNQKSSSRSSTQFDMKSFTYYSTASSVLKVFNQSWKWIKEWRINGFGLDEQDDETQKQQRIWTKEKERNMEHIWRVIEKTHTNACVCSSNRTMLCYLRRQWERITYSTLHMHTEQ